MLPAFLFKQKGLLKGELFCSGNSFNFSIILRLELSKIRSFWHVPSQTLFLPFKYQSFLYLLWTFINWNAIEPKKTLTFSSSQTFAFLFFVKTHFLSPIFQSHSLSFIFDSALLFSEQLTCQWLVTSLRPALLSCTILPATILSCKNAIFTAVLGVFPNTFVCCYLDNFMIYHFSVAFHSATKGMPGLSHYSQQPSHSSLLTQPSH